LKTDVSVSRNYDRSVASVIFQTARLMTLEFKLEDWSP
jgi:hypothetical protein